MLKKLCTALCVIALSFMALLSTSYAKASAVQVMISTDQGNIQLELYPDKAPKTVENFLTYVNDKYYDGLVFHRVIKGFMIQAGAFDKNLNIKEPKGEPVVNESFNGLKNAKGTIAMARKSDPNSAKSQFYINVVDNFFLDPRSHKPGYTVFGSVISGIEVAEKISKLPTKKSGHMADVPVSPTHILKARVIPQAQK
jgi:cyclophilin family peptidyl-prolyl cis-trans isomerase